MVPESTANAPYTRCFQISGSSYELVKIDVLYNTPPVMSSNCLLCTPTLDQNYRDRQVEEKRAKDQLDWATFRLNTFKEAAKTRDWTLECIESVREAEEQRQSAADIYKARARELRHAAAEIQHYICVATEGNETSLGGSHPRFYYGPITTEERSAVVLSARQRPIYKASDRPEYIIDWKAEPRGSRRMLFFPPVATT